MLLTDSVRKLEEGGSENHQQGGNSSTNDITEVFGTREKDQKFGASLYDFLHLFKLNLCHIM